MTDQSKPDRSGGDGLLPLDGTKLRNLASNIDLLQDSRQLRRYAAAILCRYADVLDSPTRDGAEGTKNKHLETLRWQSDRRYTFNSDDIKYLLLIIDAALPKPAPDAMHRAYLNAFAPELPDILTPPAIDQLFARDDLYTARAVFARIRNFGFSLVRSAPVPPADRNKK